MKDIFKVKNGALNSLIEKAVEMESKDAAKLETGIEGDHPVTIYCGGKFEDWKSIYLAYHYYRAGAFACDGTSEGGRYWQVFFGIEDAYGNKDKIPNDTDDRIPDRKTA